MLNFKDPTYSKFSPELMSVEELTEEDDAIRVLSDAEGVFMTGEVFIEDEADLRALVAVLGRAYTHCHQLRARTRAKLEEDRQLSFNFAKKMDDHEVQSAAPGTPIKGH